MEEIWERKVLRPIFRKRKIYSTGGRRSAGDLVTRRKQDGL